MLRQRFIDEGVIGVQQIDDAAVLAQDAFEQQFGFAAEALPKVVVERLRLGALIFSSRRYSH